jgi:hypothetical protein
VNDEALSNAWTALEPAGDQRRRIDVRVSAWLEARDTPLAAEWLEIFRVAPVPALGLVTVSAIALAAAPPLVWFASALI